MSRLLFGVLAVLLPVVGQAQPVYDAVYRPAEGRYYVLETPHFELIFEAGLERAAREAGVILEQNLRESRALVGLRGRLHMPVVLNGFNDLANGLVDPLPFRQEVESPSLKGKSLGTGFVSWLEAVLSHELAHAAQAEVRPRWGVGGMTGLLWPDFARTLNFTVPSGITEGVAVYRESRIRPGAGRLNHSLFNMRFRAATGSGRPWSLAQMTEPSIYDVPADRFYVGGAHLVAYLAEKHGEGFFAHALRLYNRWPFFGFAVPLWIVTGEAPYRMGRRFRVEAAEREARRLAELGPVQEGQILPSRPGTSVRRPRWADDSTLVGYVEGYDVRPGFYRIDPTTGKRQAIAWTSITEDYHFAFDRSKQRILHAAYRPDLVSTRKWTADVYSTDAGTGRSRRHSEEKRVFTPVPAPGGGMWALQNEGPFNRWVHVRDNGEVIPLTRYGRSNFRQLVPSPVDGRVAVLADVRGRQGIFLAHLLEDGSPAFEPVLMPERGALYDPTWSPDGRYLVFSADPDGVAQIFAHDTASGRITQLTRVAYGAVEPDISPDGFRLAFTSYAHERYELVIMPFEPEHGVDQARHLFSSGLGLPWVLEMSATPYPSAGSMVRPYRSVPRLLRPRAISPVLDRGTPVSEPDEVDLGWAAGLRLAGADPLQRWSYELTGYRQAGQWWGEAGLRNGTTPFRPSLRLYASPSTQLVRRVDEQGRDVDTVRLGREEQGVEVGASLPLYLDVDVFQTSAAFALRGRYRRVRFFDRAGEAVTAFSRRWTLLPAAVLAYRLQANRRDITPTSGVRLRMNAEWDLRARNALAGRALLTSADLFRPVLLGPNQSLRVTVGTLSQSRGSLYDPDIFLPRGFRDEAFLGAGTYLKGGLEYTVPLRFVENGLFLLPVYVHAVYAYGFAEAVVQAAPVAAEHYSSVGLGLGVRFRVAHFVNLRLKAGIARQLETGDWRVVYR